MTTLRFDSRDGNYHGEQDGRAFTVDADVLSEQVEVMIREHKIRRDVAEEFQQDPENWLPGEHAGCAWDQPITGTLYDYQTAESIRPATPEELTASIAAARHDGGAGVIRVDGRDCYAQ